MENGEGSSDFNVVKAELFEAISHPLRIKILQALSEKEMGFAELGRSVGINSGGHLSFHLNKLRHLIRMNKRGDYELTADGKEALWSVKSLQKSTSWTPTRTEQASVKHKSLVKPTIAVIMIAIIFLGGLGAYEQSEFAFQQQQLSSQQKVLGLLQNGLPFTNGQSASMVIGQKDFTTYDAMTSQNGLNNPTDVAFDSSGNMWVSEFDNARVLEFVPPFSQGMAASKVIGQKDFTAYGTSTTNNGLGAGCCGPNALTFDSSGNLWVDDFGANRILEYVPPFSNGMNASIVIGHKDFTSPGITNHLIAPQPRSAFEDRLFSPAGLAFDSIGNLWVLDSGNNRALEFKPPFKDGMNASLVLGQSNFQDNLPSRTINGLSCNFGYLALDPAGDVWVGDTMNNRLVEFEPPFRDGMDASVIISQSSIQLNSTQAPYGSARLGWLITFDNSGNLWASSNDRLLAFRPPFTTGIRSFPSLEIGQPNFTSTLWSGGRNGFNILSTGAPSGIGFDRSGNLWVADSGNNRVLEFSVGLASQGLPASQTVSGLPQQLLFLSAVLGIGTILALIFIRTRRIRI